jgi:exopolyphosphatase/guanosine-5'-triphosphate,3'-diphosphate pyrophosphatase
VSRLLSRERYQRARALGAAMRLACDISGRNPSVLGQTTLELRPDAVVLRSDPNLGEELLGDIAAKRGATLAGLLERELKIRSSPGRPRKTARVA